MDVQGPAVDVPQVAGPGIGGGGMGSFVFSVNGAVPGRVRYELALPQDGLYLFRVRSGGVYAPAPGAPSSEMGLPSGTFSLLLEALP
jgi:hypothetical protein